MDPAHSLNLTCNVKSWLLMGYAVAKLKRNDELEEHRHVIPFALVP